MSKKEIVLGFLGAVAIYLLVSAFYYNRPTDSSSWASWVQAFGSIAAIGLAIWLQASNESSKRNSANEAVKVFISRFNISLGIMQGAVVAQDWNAFRSQLAVLSEMMAFGRALPVFDAYSDQQSIVVELRAMGALLLAQNATENQMRTWDALKIQIWEFRSRVDGFSRSVGMLNLQEALDIVAVKNNN